MTNASLYVIVSQRGKSRFKEKMAFVTTEKRHFPRLRAAFPLRYQIRGGREYNSTLSENISLNGAGLTNQDFIPPNTLLNVEMNILSRILRSQAKVVWAMPLPHSDRYRLGLEFLEFDPQEKKFLADYLGMQTAIS